MKKNRLLIMIMILLVAFPIININAAVGDRKLGIAIDIIDGEALVVKFGDSNIFIKLIGINSEASEKALQYMNNHVKGKYVYVETEDIYNGDVPDTKYYYAYVYLKDTGEMVNYNLLKEGLVDLKTAHLSAAKYFELSSAQSYAKSKKIGIWQPDTTYKSSSKSKSNSKYTYSGDGININTASSSQLTELKSITSSIASNIIDYRKENPFNNIEELKFVNGITKDIYDDIYDEITVITNINTADSDELLTLSGLTKTDTESIIDYRDKNGRFTSLEQFYTKTNLTSSDYENNRYFIALDYNTSVDYRISSTVVNINTASYSQIKSASSGILSSSEAEAIVDNRKEGYSYKTLMELCYLPSSSISVSDINRLEDNFNLYTDINEADTDELRSLFGNGYTSSEVEKIKDKRPFNNISDIEDIIGSSKYNEIKDYIYVDTYREDDRVNLNLASKSQLDTLSLSSDEISRIRNRQKEMTYPNQIPFNISDINKEVSLYTNINTATRDELETLYDMSSSLIDDIIDYRDDQPFGSSDEIEDFFRDKSERNIYNEIYKFLVVR